MKRLILATLLLTLTACDTPAPEATTPTEAPAPTTPTPAPSNSLTIDQYTQLTAGMTLADVEAIIGKPGTEISRTEIAGAPTTAVYQWQEGLTSINITMQDDVLIGKAQAALDTSTSEITLAQFNQLQNGMSLEDVESILGEGIEVGRTEIPGIPVSSIVMWNGPAFSSITITLQDGKATSLSQAGLK